MENFDFIAIDFETATHDFDSACSVGLAMVRNLEIVDHFYSLIKPPLCRFNPRNIAIHGITPHDVESAPSFEELWIKIHQYFGSYAILAHNAQFDMSVLKESYLWSSCIDNFKYIDTVSLAKDFVPGHKDLQSCVDYLEIPLFHHHNALDDAEACANIAIRCIKVSGHSNLGSLCFALPNVKVHNFKDLFESRRSAPRAYPSTTVRPSQLTPTVSNINSGHPLFGKNIVFTGELSIDRQEAMQMAINSGAVVRTSVSKKTNYLVVGRQDISIVGEDGMSSKEEKAHELNREGHGDIHIIGEVDFINLVNSQEVSV